MTVFVIVLSFVGLLSAFAIKKMADSTHEFQDFLDD